MTILQVLKKADIYIIYVELVCDLFNRIGISLIVCVIFIRRDAKGIITKSTASYIIHDARFFEFIIVLNFGAYIMQKFVVNKMYFHQDYKQTVHL